MEDRRREGDLYVPSRTLKGQRTVVCFYLNYHLVLITKLRHRCMTGPIPDRLEAPCRSNATKWEYNVLEFNGEADHVHLLLALTPKVLPSAFVYNQKTVTSRLLRKEFADHLNRYYWGKPVLRSRSYCVSAPLTPPSHAWRRADIVWAMEGLIIGVGQPERATVL
ncbi:MAG: IS200/IS605 family transposase [Acidiferrobacter thiooxydans]